MIKLLYILAGGALGTGARYWLSGIAQRLISGTFPLGTFSVNMIGSFIAGLLWGIAEYFEFSPNVRLFMFIGFLGGFTTFSTFSLESMNLLRTHRYLDATVNILATNIIGILMVITGMILARIFINYIKS